MSLERFWKLWISAGGENGDVEKVGTGRTQSSLVYMVKLYEYVVCICKRRDCFRVVCVSTFV